jgi:hypothetical protein
VTTDEEGFFGSPWADALGAEFGAENLHITTELLAQVLDGRARPKAKARR